jgi:hypothetical protein
MRCSTATEVLDGRTSSTTDEQRTIRISWSVVPACSAGLLLLSVLCSLVAAPRARSSELLAQEKVLGQRTWFPWPFLVYRTLDPDATGFPVSDILEAKPGAFFQPTQASEFFAISFWKAHCWLLAFQSYAQWRAIRVGKEVSPLCCLGGWLFALACVGFAVNVLDLTLLLAVRQPTTFSGMHYICFFGCDEKALTLALTAFYEGGLWALSLGTLALSTATSASVHHGKYRWLPCAVFIILSAMVNRMPGTFAGRPIVWNETRYVLAQTGHVLLIYLSMLASAWPVGSASPALRVTHIVEDRRCAEGGVFCSTLTDVVAVRFSTAFVGVLAYLSWLLWWMQSPYHILDGVWATARVLRVARVVLTLVWSSLMTISGPMLCLATYMAFATVRTNEGAGQTRGQRCLHLAIVCAVCTWQLWVYMEHITTFRWIYGTWASALIHPIIVSGMTAFVHLTIHAGFHTGYFESALEEAPARVLSLASPPFLVLLHMVNTSRLLTHWFDGFGGAPAFDIRVLDFLLHHPLYRSWAMPLQERLWFYFTPCSMLLLFLFLLCCAKRLEVVEISLHELSVGRVLVRPLL